MRPGRQLADPRLRHPGISGGSRGSNGAPTCREPFAPAAAVLPAHQRGDAVAALRPQRVREPPDQDREPDVWSAERGSDDLLPGGGHDDAALDVTRGQDLDGTLVRVE